MPAETMFFSNAEMTEELNKVELSEITRLGQIGEGKVKSIYVKNTGDTILRNISVDINGEASDKIIVNNFEGKWGNPNTTQIVRKDNLKPGDSFSFDIRPIYKENDVESELEFNISISGESTTNG